MSKKTKPLNILYIEDEKQDYERLQMEANPYRILLTHETNLEDGIKTFEEKGEKFFDGIILDALCLIKKDDSSPKKAHVLKAWKEFHALAPNLMKVIFTGETAFAKALHELLEETEVHIFNKGSVDDVRRMLTMFVDESRHKEDKIISSRFADVFEVFDKSYLDSSDKETLLECIKNMNSNDEAKIKNTLSGIRRLQESIYRAINRIDKNMVPDDFLSDGNVQFRSIQWHLRGRLNKEMKKCEGEEYVPFGTNIDQFADSIYTVVSNYGSHKKFNDVSKYTLSTITFAILDLLLWFKEVVQERNKHT
ncbi:MAG: hypothetical protein ABIB41_12360 [Nitrospirota bacterium]